MKARGSKLKTGADLNGKIIAVTTLGGTLQLGVEQWMDKNGGDSKTRPLHRSPNLEHAGRAQSKAASTRRWSPNHSSPKTKPTSKYSPTRSPRSPRSGSAPSSSSQKLGYRQPGCGEALHRSDERDRALGEQRITPKRRRSSSPLSGVPLTTFEAMERGTYTDQFTQALLQPGIDAAFRYGALKESYDTGEIVTAAAPYLK